MYVIFLGGHLVGFPVGFPPRCHGEHLPCLWKLTHCLWRVEAPHSIYKFILPRCKHSKAGYLPHHLLLEKWSWKSTFFAINVWTLISNLLFLFSTKGFPSLPPTICLSCSFNSILPLKSYLLAKKCSIAEMLKIHLFKGVRQIRQMNEEDRSLHSECSLCERQGWFLLGQTKEHTSHF